MPIYAIKTAAAWASDASLNGATFVEVADPGEVTGLTNGTAYQAREVVRSDLSAQFTPLAAASFGATYAGGVTSGIPASDPTALTLPIGDANADRWVVFTVQAFLSGNVADKVVSITLNGGACTVLARSGGAGSANPFVAVCITDAKVPTGTTAVVSIDWVDTADPASTVAVRVEGYRLISGSAPTIADTDSLNNSPLTLDVQEGDVLIAAMVSPGSGRPDPTTLWTGATHRSTVDLNAAGLWSSVADDLAVAAAATGRAVGNTSTDRRMVGAVLRAPA